MKLRDYAESKSDILKIDPRKLRIDPGFNVRDFSLPENIEHVATIKASIKGIGLKEPLSVRLGTDAPTIVGGECRYRAIMELIAEGEPIETVSCVPEDKRTSDEERIAELHVRNSGKRFAPIELSALVRRLTGYGWSVDKIAKAWGMSPSNVSHLVTVEMLPEEVKQQVREGAISASAAAHTVVAHGESEGASIIREAVSESRANGNGRATPKTLQAVAIRRAAPGKRIGMTLGAVKTEKVVAFLSRVHKLGADDIDDFKDEARRLMNFILA